MKLIVQIPCYNEEATLPLVVNSIPRIIPGIDKVETMIIDDGSRDKTDHLLIELTRRDHHLRFLRLSRNTGQWAAISAGFSASRGDYVIVMDGDLQHAPEDIHLLIEKMAEGYLYSICLFCNRSFDLHSPALF